MKRVLGMNTGIMLHPMLSFKTGYLRVILKCNGAYIYVKLISEIARLRGVVSLSCE